MAVPSVKLTPESATHYRSFDDANEAARKVTEEAADPKLKFTVSHFGGWPVIVVSRKRGRVWTRRGYL